MSISQNQTSFGIFSIREKVFVLGVPIAYESLSVFATQCVCVYISVGT